MNLPYRPLGKLGEGGMGTVYRVEDPRLGRQAALKLVNDPGDQELVARFVREGRVTARLDHPGVPPVFEAGATADGQPYLLLRVIEGELLAARIAALHQQRRGELEDLVDALARVGETVGYAHSVGVTHRDLKPSNVMVGRFGEVMVLDWGLAKLEGTPEPSFLGRTTDPARVPEGVHLTQRGVCLGTPGYMPPEQAGGEGDEGPPADVFALGAILTEVLTGEPPVVGGSPLNRIVATLEGRIRRPSQIDPRVPWELDALAARALAQRPQDRPSAPDFVAGLRAWRAGRPIQGVRYSRAQRLLLAVRRRPARFVAGGALALLTLGGASAAAIVVRVQREAALAEGLVRERERASEAERERAAEQARAARAEQENARAKAESAAALEAQARAEQDRLKRVLDQLGEARDLARRAADPGAVTRALDAAVEAARGERSVVLEAVQVYRQANQLERALRLVRARIDPARPDPELFLAAWQLQVEVKDAEAERWLAEVGQRLGPDAPVAVFVRAHHVLVDGRDPRRALAMAQELERKHPDFAPIYLLEARALLPLGRADEARAALDRGLELWPNSAECLAMRGQLALGTNPAAALRDLDAAIQLRPDLLEAYYRRAQAYFVAQQYGRAEQDLSRLLEREREPVGRVRALQMRAAVRVELRRFAEARADVDAYFAAGALPQPSILLTRGRVLVEELRLDEARVDLERAQSMRPADGDVALELAFLSLEQGRWDEAQARLLQLEGPLGQSAPMIPLILQALGVDRPALRREQGWRGLLGRHLAGEVSAAALVAAAKEQGVSERERLCEAYGWLGVAADRRGDAQNAIDAYRRCLDTQQRDFLEFTLARCRLRALLPR
ncbi:MAG: protein kinase [Planctomycetota bacterium]